MDSKLLLLLAANFSSLDRELQQAVYQEFYALVYAPIMFMVKEHAGTEDIIQESFFKTIRKMPHIENEASLNAWIKKVARNDTLNYLRKNKKHRNQIISDGVFTYET